MLLALGGVLLYVAFRFQWKFAVGAIISLVHDVVTKPFSVAGLVARVRELTTGVTA